MVFAPVFRADASAGLPVLLIGVGRIERLGVKARVHQSREHVLDVVVDILP